MSSPIRKAYALASSNRPRVRVNPNPNPSSSEAPVQTDANAADACLVPRATVDSISNTPVKSDASAADRPCASAGMMVNEELPLSEAMHSTDLIADSETPVRPTAQKSCGRKWSYVSAFHISPVPTADTSGKVRYKRRQQPSATVLTASPFLKELRTIAEAKADKANSKATKALFKDSEKKSPQRSKTKKQKASQNNQA